MIKSDSLKEISASLVKAQKEMSCAVKDAVNPFFKSNYADLNAIREAVLPALNNNGISVLQLTMQEDTKTFVRTLLLHSSSEYIGADTPILTAKQNDPQAMGSAISYARRYGLQSLLCVGAVDDDAESSVVREEKPAPPQLNNKVSFSKKTVLKQTEGDDI